MSIRKPSTGAAVVLALAVAAHLSAQDQPAPGATFRTRIDVLTVDVAIVDKQGRAVEDLRPGDFSVKVDGRSRPVVSAQLIKVDRARPVESQPRSADSFVSTNAGPQSGRRVILAVDQTLIVPGSIAPLMRSASRFVDTLAPADYAALLAFPEPGPRVDFTTDKASVRRAMEGVVGQPAKIRTTTFNLSLQEAQAIDRSEKTLVNVMAGSIEAIWNTMGPTMQRVITRGCRSLTIDELKTIEHLDDLRQCLRDLVREAGNDAQDLRADATMSLRRLESFLKELSPLDGPKTLVLVSAGLVADEAALDEIARLAADARVTIHVIAVDRERERDRTDLANGQSELRLQDRALEMHGLETIAERTGGGLHRAIGPAEEVFDRLASELSASYVLAVERRENDPEHQRIEVDVKRRGVTLRSPRMVTAKGADPRRSSDDALREALASPLPLPGISLRVSTFVRQESSTGMYRLDLAAQVGEPDGPAGQFAVGYAVIDSQNRLVTSHADRVQLTASGRPGDRLHYEAAMSLPPGAYLVRVAVVDKDGRHGAVVRPVELPNVVATVLTTSDLIVGALPAGGQALTPGIEPHVDGKVAAYLELYAPAADDGRVTVTLEIAEGEASPALTSAALNISAGAQPTWRIASGAIDAALLPGRYVARAAVRRDGVSVRTISRPFVLDRAGTASPPPSGPATAVRIGPVPLPVEARARTAVYVSAFVRALANVVGQEEFEVSGRKVTSDFLLVQHPASPGDFLTYRDVSEINGAAVPDRQERLADLFLKSGSPARDRVRQITQAAEQYVPSLLNPIFVVAFLQSDLQARFELTEQDAGRDWPAAVKAVSFVEVARPTILRGGLQGERDVPVRGTAWIEPATGRVLQTELLVPSGRSTTRIVTKFALDQRLQIMVPEQMKTQNPNGVATYRNFRRFSVETETAIDTQNLP